MVHSSSGRPFKTTHQIKDVSQRADPIIFLLSNHCRLKWLDALSRQFRHGTVLRKAADEVYFMRGIMNKAAAKTRARNRRSLAIAEGNPHHSDSTKLSPDRRRFPQNLGSTRFPLAARRGRPTLPIHHDETTGPFAPYLLFCRVQQAFSDWRLPNAR